MCYESLRITRQFCEPCIERQHEGMAYIVSRPETQGRDWKLAWEQAGILYGELSREDVQRGFEGLNPERVQKAFLLPDCSIRTDVLLQHLAAAAENAGAEIRARTPIRSLWVEGSRVAGVETGSGEQLEGRMVILAIGTGGSALQSMLPRHGGGRTSPITVVPMKTHLVACRPELGRLPFCVVDAEGFNHVPHAPTSVFGSDRWIPVALAEDESAVPAESERLWSHVVDFFPGVQAGKHQIQEWAGTTVQALHPEQTDPTRIARPVVVDHANDSPPVQNLLSVFPGRATLWPELADMTQRAVFERLSLSPAPLARPPWAR